MAKDTFYFSHDYHARNDDKILELRSEFGAEGYGVFWMLVETMAENENGGIDRRLIGGLSLGYGVAKGKLIEIIDKCVELELFYNEEDKVFNKRLLNHKHIRKNLKEAGKKGAEIRWGGHSSPNGKTMPKERKGKEIKGVFFDEKKENVTLDDGTVQELGESQKSLLVEGGLSPKQVIKGSVY